jgi:hypothetical protein
MSQPSGGRERLVSRAFVALADTLVDEYDIIDLLDHLVAYSVDLLAADAAGILLADARGALHAVASSSEEAVVCPVPLPEAAVRPIDSQYSGCHSECA